MIGLQARVRLSSVSASRVRDRRRFFGGSCEELDVAERPSIHARTASLGLPGSGNKSSASELAIDIRLGDVAVGASSSVVSSG